MSQKAREALVGMTVDRRYEVGSVLGAGSFGVVYRVTHKTLGKVQALKLLRREATMDLDIVARFEREARATCQIGHENIIDITDFGRDEQYGYYFVMEYLEGRNLAALLDAEGPMPARRSIRIIKQIADALAATHERGIIHRDLTPSNIHLIKRRRVIDFVKVLDFGLAHMRVPEGAKRLTAAGMILGSPLYMSPEQAQGKPLDARSDIYSLGVILYHMLTGAPPFNGDNNFAILLQHVHEEPKPPRQVRPDLVIEPALEAIVLRCMCKTPDERFQSMNEVFDACEAAERDIPEDPPTAMESTNVSSTGEIRLPAEGPAESPLTKPASTESCDSADAVAAAEGSHVEEARLPIAGDFERTDIELGSTIREAFSTSRPEASAEPAENSLVAKEADTVAIASPFAAEVDLALSSDDAHAAQVADADGEYLTVRESTVDPELLPLSDRLPADSPTATPPRGLPPRFVAGPKDDSDPLSPLPTAADRIAGEDAQSKAKGSSRKAFYILLPLLLAGLGVLLYFLFRGAQ